MTHRSSVIFVLGLSFLGFLVACSNNKSADTVIPTLAVLPDANLASPTQSSDVQSGVDQLFTQTAQAQQEIAPTETVIAAFNQALTATELGRINPLQVTASAVAQSTFASLLSSDDQSSSVIATTTPLPGILSTVDNLSATIAAAPTIAPLLFRQNNSLQQTATALPANCILYTVKDGDTPFGIATDYGIDGNDLMAVNGFDDERASSIQIGDVLIVPLPGCALTHASR